MNDPVKEVLKFYRERRRDMKNMRRRGLSYTQIGDVFGVSRQRAEQIIKGRAR